jgi:BolA protein
MTIEREQIIRQRIEQALQPQSLELIDDSHLHAGHGATGGHYTVRIVSDAFAGKTMVQRHRLVYDAVGDLMASEIHALSIDASTTAEQTNSNA